MTPADIHDGPEHMLQSETEYIDARPHQPAFDQTSFLFHHAQRVAFLKSLNGAGYVWLSSTAINRDSVCSASHGPGSAT
jgi:hypothetical protein